MYIQYHSLFRLKETHPFNYQKNQNINFGCSSTFSFCQSFIKSFIYFFFNSVCSVLSVTQDTIITLFMVSWLPRVIPQGRHSYYVTYVTILKEKKKTMKLKSPSDFLLPIRPKLSSFSSWKPPDENPYHLFRIMYRFL